MTNPQPIQICLALPSTSCTRPYDVFILAGQRWTQNCGARLCEVSLLKIQSLRPHQASTGIVRDVACTSVMARRVERSFSFVDNDDSSLWGHSQAHDYENISPPPYMKSPITGNKSSLPIPTSHRSRAIPSYQPPSINTREGSIRELGHSTSNRTTSTTTPGADNMSEAAAGGGIAGVALGVANTPQKINGEEAARNVESFEQSGQALPQERSDDDIGSDTPYIPEPPPSNHRLSYHPDPFASPAPSWRSNPFDENRRGSPTPPPARLTPKTSPSTVSMQLNECGPQGLYANGRAYFDNPYSRFSTAWDPRVSRAYIDPNEIEDEGEDVTGPPVPRRGSTLGLNTESHSNLSGAAPATGGVAVGGLVGALGGYLRVNGSSTQKGSGQYGPVGGTSVDEAPAEKSEWLDRQNSGRKRLRWTVGIIIGIIVVGVIGGVVGGLKRSSSRNGNSSSGSSAAQDDASGDLDKDSTEIKKLLDNPNLHKVFPGVDYTPFNAQYPDCLLNPPSQNNVTRDVAVLSQLTNTVRLYGTDCNQTEMVLHAISKLDLSDVKIWLGVWLDGNSTTNDRGIEAMYDILAKNGPGPFAGVVIGNEVLYRGDMTESQLRTILSDVRKNFTAQKLDLHVATSDLGDDWTTGLAADVDAVMSNIHPFFAGVTVDAASGWTWDFWQQHNALLTKETSKKNIISEVGWPSGGGTHCGEVDTCAKGSVAGIEEMNTFMDGFICQSLANGTNFFWSVRLLLRNGDAKTNSSVGLKPSTSRGSQDIMKLVEDGRTNGV